jgi:hypothetical protein
MHLDMVGILYGLQGVPFVPRLTTRLLATGLALALQPRFREPIAGGWFAAVAAVLSLLAFQDPYPSLELVNELLLLGHALLLLLEESEKGTDQLCDQRDHAFFALRVSGVYLFMGRQRKSDHVPIVPGLYDFSKSKSNQGWVSSYVP